RRAEWVRRPRFGELDAVGFREELPPLVILARVFEDWQDVGAEADDLRLIVDAGVGRFRENAALGVLRLAEDDAGGFVAVDGDGDRLLARVEAIRLQVLVG